MIFEPLSTNSISITLPLRLHSTSRSLVFEARSSDASIPSSVDSAIARNSDSVMLHSGEFIQTLILIVKRIFDWSRLAMTAIVAASPVLLAGCGQKGPLTLPAKTQPAASAAPAQPAPAVPADGNSPVSK